MGCKLGGASPVTKGSLHSWWGATAVEELGGRCHSQNWP